MTQKYYHCCYHHPNQNPSTVPTSQVLRVTMGIKHHPKNPQSHSIWRTSAENSHKEMAVID